MIPELLSSRHKAPRRKFRGQARYFRMVHRQAKNFSLNPDPGCSCDLGHYHADWPGWGNLSWSYRLKHIEALATVFRTIAKTRDVFPMTFQCFILILGDDAGQDATYLHTPNESGSEFPFIPEGVDWEDDRLMSVFQTLLPEYTLRIGCNRLFDEYAESPRECSSFFIYSPAVGVPLEK